MIMSRKLIFAILLIIVGLTASVCGAADDLASVRASGVLRFGVSSDYYPFVYMEGTTLDGLDIALVKEIGSRLGVEVEPIDMAFDSLIDAVIIGQVDLCGGGFSITEERRQQVDFTMAYYQAGGAVICRSSDPVSEANIRSAKVGFQKGTHFEQWVASNLLMGGVVSTANVFTFSEVDDVINALKNREVDLVLVDEDVFLSKYRNDSSLVIVENKIVNEKYAYAAVKGSTLVPEINRVFREMVKDGTAQQIADKYFSMDFSDSIEVSITRPSQAVVPTAVVDTDLVISREAVPEPTAVPAASFVNPAGCRNGMQFVNDVSIPDRTVLLPNMSATKTWNLLNTGTCTWTTGYTFNYVKGSVFSPADYVSIPKNVAPGDTIELSVNFTTPAQNGEYVGYWQMRSPEGTNFGQTVWYDFQVNASTGTSNQRTGSGTPRITKWYPDFYSTDRDKCPKVYYEVENAHTVEFYVDNKLFATTSNLNGFTSLCAPKKRGIYTFAIRAIGEEAIATSFQFMNETNYPDPKLGVNLPTPLPGK